MLILLVLYQVITRYVARHPLGAADELSAMLMVLITFIGLAYAWKEKRHIRLTFIMERLPIRAAMWLRLIMLTVVLGFVAVLAKASYDLLASSMKLGLKSYDLAIPLAWTQISMPLGSALLFIWVMIDIIGTVRAIRGGGEEKI